MTDNQEGLEDRVERLEGSTGRIERMLEQLTSASGPAHDKAQEHTERHLDRPSVAEMVIAELAKAKQQEAEQAAKDAEKSEQQTIKDQLAKLTEQPPAQPQPRRQRIMWGAR